MIKQLKIMGELVVGQVAAHQVHGNNKGQRIFASELFKLISSSTTIGEIGEAETE